MAQNDPSTPWNDGRPSLFEFIQARIDKTSQGLSDAAMALPDDEQATEALEGISYAAGAADGIIIKHARLEPDEAEAEQVYILLQQALADSGKNATFYEAIKSWQTIAFVPAIVRRLVRDKALDPNAVYALALRIAREAPDREAVKTAIAILSVYPPTPEARQVLLTLGNHDEFTYYAAIALSFDEVNGEADLWRLARNSNGWGRIHAVSRLVPSNNAQLRRWLIVEGFRNDILNEYLALTCAREGGLLEALRARRPDADILAGAGDIFIALTSDVAFANLADLANGAEAATLYLSHVRAAPNARAFTAAEQIKAFLQRDDVDLGEFLSKQWPRAGIIAAADDVLARRD